MRKAILLAPTPPPAGGIASWTVRMMNTTLKNGWMLIVVDEKVAGGREVFGNLSSINLVTEVLRCLRIWKGLNEAIKDKDVEIVHSCIPAATRSMLREYICARISRKHQKKFIIHFRCTVPNTTKGIFARFMLKKLCNSSDLILSLNTETSNYLQKVTNTPVKLVPNFVLQNELQEKCIYNSELETVLYIGGVIETKGAYDLLNVAESFPKLTFRCIGKTDSKVEATAKRRGLENVIFTGEINRDAISEELKKADVFLFLTYFEGEGFSNALLEAMAAGLPCIVTNWAANADMVDDDKGGYVVPIKSPHIVVAALEILTQKSIRERQSKYNLEKVKKNYTDRIVSDMYVDAYEECIGR